MLLSEAKTIICLRWFIRVTLYTNFKGQIAPDLLSFFAFTFRGIDLKIDRNGGLACIAQ